MAIEYNGGRGRASFDGLLQSAKQLAPAFNHPKLSLSSDYCSERGDQGGG
jgi:hypothetical protein